jgi:hypothetical protein
MIGYPIFKAYLPPKYYIHLQKLAFGIHIGESTTISLEQLADMDALLSSFVDDFPYNERHIVQTVHCVKHFSITTQDFGPLGNYSTFNFESVIGKNKSVSDERSIHTLVLSNHQAFSPHLSMERKNLVSSWQ